MQRDPPWSEHAKHYILTSDFDAALTSETYLEREKLVTAAKKARKFSWAGTGSAAINTASNGTSAGVLALVRTRWFSKPLAICTDEARFSLPQPTIGREGSCGVEGREILLFTAYFEHSVGFRSDINANLMQDVCFSHERRKASFYFGSRFQFRAKLVARLVHTRRRSWASEVGSISGHSRGTTHMPCGQRSEARPLIQKCEIAKAVPWGPHALRCQADAQHQLRIGGVQTADWEVQEAESAQHERTPRTEHATH